ncbi:MAG: transketolase [Candidatus Eisenbacteria bacterium]|nr:transketolase [Candidatus Eisenbacteria bacterium]
MNARCPDVDALRQKARQLRRDLLEMITEAGSGHPGGSLSAVEILVSLYFCKMRHRPEEPTWPMRDRFIMSKGHASPVLYATLADCGYFPREELKTFRKLGSRLQGHVHAGVPGVELSTGSMEQGFSVANGIALGARLRGVDFRVYCLLGDGEIQEGQVWEAAMMAAHHKLDNVCAVLDANGVQENGPVSAIKGLEPLDEKWSSFGWHVIEVDGHSFEEILAALDEAETVKGRPTFVIAHTVKGRGVSFMEGQAGWHGKAPSREELKRALSDLGFQT